MTAVQAMNGILRHYINKGSPKMMFTSYKVDWQQILTFNICQCFLQSTVLEPYISSSYYENRTCEYTKFYLTFSIRTKIRKQTSISLRKYSIRAAHLSRRLMYPWRPLTFILFWNICWQPHVSVCACLVIEPSVYS